MTPIEIGLLIFGVVFVVTLLAFTGLLESEIVIDMLELVAAIFTNWED